MIIIIIIVGLNKTREISTPELIHLLTAHSVETNN